MKKVKLVIGVVIALVFAIEVKAQTIVNATSGEKQVDLAAKELRRYIYTLTGKLPLIKTGASKSTRGSRIILNLDKNLGAEEFTITADEKKQTVQIHGGTGQGILYGSYRYLEELGIRFYLHGDVIPEQKVAFKVTNLTIKGKPLFDVRGILPFHDFPEGPDWWSSNNYKMVFSQLPKLGMNFAGFHVYPQAVGDEPLVWIGEKNELNADGTVNSAYPARHFTTLTGAAGYAPKKTSDYVLGAADFYDIDAYGEVYMRGRAPVPATDSACVGLFNDAGKFFGDVFSYAKKLGIKTCVGTETKMEIPGKLKSKLKAEGKNPEDSTIVQRLYEGSFSWISKNYPLDYYWLWTPEDWTWKGNTVDQTRATLRDLRSAYAAMKNVDAKFTLATSGWVLGPAENRSAFDQLLPKEMPFSCINRGVGFVPVDPDFANIAGRPKWAIPWLEDDPAMTAPQFWVGRMQRDADDALAYGCNGLIGIHWRTINIAPMISALGRAGWSDRRTSPIPGRMNYEQAKNFVANHPDEKPPLEFYREWAASEFGLNVADSVAGIFTQLDGAQPVSSYIECRTKGNMPRPACWMSGPGGINYDTLSWQQREPEYAFIQQMEALKHLVKGVANKERFDYWLANFYYLRAIGQFNCTQGAYRKRLNEIKLLKEKANQKQAAEEILLPLRIQAIKEFTQIHYYLYQFLSTTGELGNLTNWQQHVSVVLIEKQGEELASLLEKPLPKEAFPTKDPIYPERLIVLDYRGNMEDGEELSLKAIITTSSVKSAVLKYRKIGSSDYQIASFRNVGRKVFSVKVPADQLKDDFEYRIEVLTNEGKKLCFPSGAEDKHHTVVVMR